MCCIIIFWFQIKKIKIDLQQSARRRQYFLACFVDNFDFPAFWLVENENVNKRTDWSKTKFTLVVFARTWEFEHVSSSPHHSQCNGKAENAVKMVKRLFKKCKEWDQSEFLALLDWKNTPTEGVGTSPARRPMGRRCKTLLAPSSNLNAALKKMLVQSWKWRNGNNTIMTETQNWKIQLYSWRDRAQELPGQEKWSAGTCTEVPNE